MGLIAPERRVYLERAYRQVLKVVSLEVIDEFDRLSRTVLPSGNSVVAIERARRGLLLKTGRRGRPVVAAMLDRLAARVAYQAGDTPAEVRYLRRCLRSRAGAFDRASAYEALVDALIRVGRIEEARRTCARGIRSFAGKNPDLVGELQRTCAGLGRTYP